MKKTDGLIFCILALSAVLAVGAVFRLAARGGETELRSDSNEEEAVASSDDSLSVFWPTPPEPSEEQPEAAEVFVGFRAPLSGRITSPFGYRSDPFKEQTTLHRGVDIAVPEGTQVAASASGTVIASAYDSVGGNYVKIDHGGGMISYYGHLRTRLVSRGDTVEQGDIIALSGNTGETTGPHLHFQLTYRQWPVDPLLYIDIPS